MFEIGKNFRNEGIDSTHNPEFTTLELYQSFANRDTLLSFTEKLISDMSVSVLGTTELKVSESADSEPINISMKTPFKVIKFMEALQEALPNDPLPKLPPHISGLKSMRKKNL